MPTSPCMKTRPLIEPRDGFRERGDLRQLSFWGLTQVWPICPFAWKEWRHAPLMCSASSKIYILWCRLWFCIRSVFPYLFRFAVPTGKNKICGTQWRTHSSLLKI